MKILLSTVALLALTITVASTGRASMLENRPMNSWPFISAHPFEDVPPSHWSHSALNKLILISRLDKSRAPMLGRPATRYEFAAALWYCDAALNSTQRAITKDLLVALNYEYALELMDIASKPMSDERLSWQNKKDLAAFDEIVKQKRGESTPDQWSDFLQQGVKVPVRTATQPVMDGLSPFVALLDANPRFFRRPDMEK